MAKTDTKYTAERSRTADIAIRKAEIHGESQWAFQYRKQPVYVTARKDEATGKVRVSTTRVKNKGK